MPYCTQCGTSVGPADQFCGKCGARQASAGTSKDYLGGISPRTASLLCYIPMVGWIAAIVVLASQRFRNDATVRFNAFQGLYLFVAWLIVDWVLGPAFSPFGFPFHRVFGSLLKLAVLATWIFMIVKVSHDQVFKLPILGDLAERSVSEQRP